MNVLGIDLSIQGTGLAFISDDKDQLKLLDAGGLQSVVFPRFSKQLSTLDWYQGLLVSPVPDGEFARWETIKDAVMGFAMHAHQVTIEGYAFGSDTAWATSLRELGGIVRYHLRKARLPLVEVTPTQLKKFATGDGRADKNIVLKEVFKRWELDLSDDNMADAFVLAKIGVALSRPGGLVGLTKFQYDVIQAIQSPKEKK